MKVSIITASYNSEKTIRKAIQSVISQTYKDIEYIIVDGASSDNTLNIVHEYQDKISTIISEKDSGIYHAFNKGIEIASGDIVGFLNSDDCFANEHVIEEIVLHFKKTNCDVVYGDLIYQKEEQNIRHWKSNHFKEKSLKYGWMPPHPTLYCKKHIYHKFGAFDQRFKISADYDFILRIFSSKEIKPEYLGKVMIHMNLGGISNGTLKGLLNKYKEDCIALRKNGIKLMLPTLAVKNIRKIYQYYRGRKNSSRHQ